MTPLPEILTRAAGDEPAGFDAGDVRRRLDQRLRRQRAVLAAAVVLVALAVGLTAIAATRAGDDDGSMADQPSLGPVSADELAAGTWIQVAGSDGAVSEDAPASLAFSDDGDLSGVPETCGFTGTWELDGDVLRTAEVRSPFEGCVAEGEVFEVVAASPGVGRYDRRPGSLALRDGDRFVAFERVDRVGRPPTASEVVDQPWTLAAGGTLTFATDGTAIVAVLGGEFPYTWELDGGEIDIEPVEEESEDGTLTFLRADGYDPLQSTSTVRIDGDRLLLATSRMAIQLRR